MTAAMVAVVMVANVSWAKEPPKMKMTTEIPPGITTPDELETRLGTLNFFDGVPDEEAVQKVYNFLDFQHGFQAYMSGVQIASMDAIRKGILEFGPANTTAFLFEELMDSKAFFLTANTTSVYMFSWLQLGDEPMVIETPPDVLGIIDDHWFKYVTDFGRLGPDKGQGGKFLILPPGYEGPVPKGYHVARTNTYGNWVIWRGFQVDGSPKPAVDATKKNFRIYPLSKKDNPPKMTFVNASGKSVNTIHRMDHHIFDEINEVVQAEPSDGQSPEILGVLASIGIKKGQPFNPDARMKKILSAAASAGSVSVTTIMSKPRDEMFYFYPGESVWMNPFPGGSYEWLNEGASLLDARAGFHFYATGITPAMAKRIIGKGSKYAYTYLDVDGNPLDGGKTYQVHLPPNVPAKDFWSFTLYDNQTRSMLQTDERFPGIDNNKPGMIKNTDGSCDIYFGPKAPKGRRTAGFRLSPARAGAQSSASMGHLSPGTTKPGSPVRLSLLNSCLGN